MHEMKDKVKGRFLLDVVVGERDLETYETKDKVKGRLDPFWMIDD